MSRLDATVARIDEISTLPQVALRVIQIARDDRAGATELMEVMQNDPALSARVLRCVNSSAYALRVKINNLQQAIAYLGTRQIRNLAMTASVADLFRRNEQIGTYRRRQLWRHLVSVGVCARVIAMRKKLPQFEDAFLAGLLHDVGIVLEDQHEHDSFARAMAELANAGCLTAAEQKHLGFDHTALGEKLAESWGFPPVVKGAIRHHHASMGYRGEGVEIVRCVEVANLLCTLKDITSVGVKLVRICNPTIASLALAREDIAVLAEDLNQELEQNTNLFAI